MWPLRSLAALVFAAATASALSTKGSRLLVVLDNLEEKDLYGQFFGDLKSRGFDISYDTPRSEELALFHLGEKNYDHLIFLPSKVKGLGPSLTPNKLVDFVNADGNILVALSSKTPTSTSLVGLLSELDISLPAERTGTVVDHFNYDTITAAETHDVLVLDFPKNVRPGLKHYFEYSESVVAFPNAVGHVLGPGELLTPVLRAPDTAYSYNPKEQAEVVDPEDLFAAGKQLGLISLFQARNSARVTVVGSAELFQDKWITAKVARPGGKTVETENRELARRVSGWTFQETGLLRVNGVEHKLVGSDELNPEIYRIKNDVTYTISISEYTWDTWMPFFVPDGDALQLEFSMLSPFHRLDLTVANMTGSQATYTTSFTLPDQHGIFNFKVNYKRPFLSNLEAKNTVSVRHFAHDEWPRSFVISGAWPWISGIGATVSGFVAFCAIWMYSKPVGGAASAKKNN